MHDWGVLLIRNADEERVNRLEAMKSSLSYRSYNDLRFGQYHAVRKEIQGMMVLYVVLLREPQLLKEQNLCRKLQHPIMHRSALLGLA